MAHALFMLDS